MNKNEKFNDIIAAKKAYKTGINITEFLRSKNNLFYNTSRIIEVAYDFQAGTYINFVKNNPDLIKAYSSEIGKIIDYHMNEQDSILDIGTGELTTISNILMRIEKKPSVVYAFDISWSRIFKGLTYAKEVLDASLHKKLFTFLADIDKISLLDKSVNITTSSHALEPNGLKLSDLLSELSRVTIDKIILFEPSYEMSSQEGKQRMDRLGYIKGIQETAENLGGKLIEQIKIENITNRLNPTYCFIITPPPTEIDPTTNIDASCAFSLPGTNIPLKEFTNYLFSFQTGLYYPKVKGIPILNNNSSILATALHE